MALEAASWSRLTFDLQLAVHLSLSQVVDGLAGVHATVVRAGLPDLQGAHSLVAEHAVAWVIKNDDLILHPDHFWLKQEGQKLAVTILIRPKYPYIIPQF